MSPTEVSDAESRHYEQATAALEHALGKLSRCSDREKQKLQGELRQLRSMHHKLMRGQVEIIVFGEISTGKSALINALMGQEVSEVDVRGGWTKDLHSFAWADAGYQVPGFADSSVLLIDTPGLNEVGGGDRASLARQAAARADLILFVIDSDMTQTEHTALSRLVATDKPIVVVLNKIDLYSDSERRELLQVLGERRLKDLVPAENLVTAAALPRQVETIIHHPDGSTRSEWRQPPRDVAAVKARILEMLERDGLALIALNAAMYAADKTDRIAKLRMELRQDYANRVIWSFASIKAIIVAANHFPVVDVLGGSASDVSMVVTLARVYGEEMNWEHAKRLVSSILTSAGWVLAGSITMEWASSALKAISFGAATVLTALPQGAAAGYSSYIVGQAAQYYFEHGASWGNEGPKAVVRRILDTTDKSSVIAQLRAEIRRKIRFNLHAEPTDPNSSQDDDS
ncbi:MAG: GTP-binding protein [Pirellulales bacterium]